jgi:hypothetical protein
VKPQALPLQKVVALARAGQTVPQALQLSALLAESISHPSLATPLQSLNVPLHVKPQDEPEHTGVEFARTAQAVPHAAQFAESVTVLISHPSIARALQSR